MTTEENVEDLELDTEDLLLSGTEMISSVSSMISAADDRQKNDAKIGRSSVRRLNFDNDFSAKLLPDFNSLSYPPSSPSSAAVSWPPTPSTKTKSCLKKTPSPLKPNVQVSFMPKENNEDVRRDFDADSLASSVADEKFQKLRALFVDVGQEFEKLARISSFSESAVASESFSTSAIEDAKAEAAFVKNLSQNEIREVFEAEFYKRTHCERKIRLLQKQNLDLEQRLSVSNAVNDRRRRFIADVKEAVEEAVDELTEKDKERSEFCSSLFEENAKQREYLRLLSDYFQRLKLKFEKLNEEYVDATTKLSSANENLTKNAADNEILRRSVAASEGKVDQLTEKIRTFEADKKRALAREEEITKDVLTMEKTLKETSAQVQRLKTELVNEKQMHRSIVDEIERANKSKLVELTQEFERRSAKFNEECEQRKHAELRNVKTEFDASLKLYDEKFVHALNERDDLAKKLKEYERNFEENLRVMYYSMQQRLACKYYELVSEFAAPPHQQQQRPPSSAAANANLNDTLADEFLDRLQRAEPLSTPRHVSTQRVQDAATSSNKRPSMQTTENFQQFLKTFGKSPYQGSTPGDPAAKF